MTLSVQSVQEMYEKAAAEVTARIDSLTPEQQNIALVAATAGATLFASHILHRWCYSSKARRSHKGNTDGSGGSVVTADDGAKANASNTIYESELAARQYMEFHYTPTKFTYTQRLKMISESYDFPVRIVNKFRLYAPRTAGYSAAQRRASATATTPTTGAKVTATTTTTAPRKRRALDVGCATGASVFEMSKYFDEVVGFDFSEVFVHLANEVKAKSIKRPGQAGGGNGANGGDAATTATTPPGANSLINVSTRLTADGEATTAAEARAKQKLALWEVPYTAPVQGDSTERRELLLSPHVFPERCHFYCGDAMNMFARQGAGFSVGGKKSAHYGDVVYWKAAVFPAPPVAAAADGFDDHSPPSTGEILAEVSRQSDSGGKNGNNDDDATEDEKFDAVLCSNLIDRVPEPRKLLAGFALLLRKGGVLVLCDPYSWWEGATAKSEWMGGRDGVKTEDEVKRILSDRFELLNESEEPFLIRDHIRHYQLGFSHCTVWRRK